MAIFKQLADEEIREHFTHYGLFCGIVPIYLTVSDCPNIHERNWVPGWAIGAVDAVWRVLCSVQSLINPDFEPGFSFTVTGEID